MGTLRNAGWKAGMWDQGFMRCSRTSPGLSCPGPGAIPRAPGSWICFNGISFPALHPGFPRKPHPSRAQEFPKGAARKCGVRFSLLRCAGHGERAEPGFNLTPSLKAIPRLWKTGNISRERQEPAAAAARHTKEQQGRFSFPGKRGRRREALIPAGPRDGWGRERAEWDGDPAPGIFLWNCRS